MHRYLIILALLLGAPSEYTFGSFPTNTEAAFSSMWFHGEETTTVIGAANTFVKIDQFVNAGATDANANVAPDPSGGNDFTIGSNDGGTYLFMIGVSFKAAGGASKNFQITPRVTHTSPNTVTNATNATPIVITTGSDHGLLVGDMLTISGVGGNTATNADHYVSAVGSSTIATLQTLAHVDTVGNGAFSGAGTVDSVSPGITLIEGVVSGTQLERGFGTGSIVLLANDVVDLCAANTEDANNLGISHVAITIQRISK